MSILHAFCTNQQLIFFIVVGIKPLCVPQLHQRIMAQAKSILAFLQERIMQRWKRSQPMPVAQVTTTQRKKLPSPLALHSRARSLTTLISPTQHSMSTTHRMMKVRLRKKDEEVRHRDTHTHKNNYLYSTLNSDVPCTFNKWFSRLSTC